jgi:hypothetical protein
VNLGAGSGEGPEDKEADEEAAAAAREAEDAAAFSNEAMGTAPVATTDEAAPGDDLASDDESEGKSSPFGGLHAESLIKFALVMDPNAAGTSKGFG